MENFTPPDEPMVIELRSSITRGGVENRSGFEFYRQLILTILIVLGMVFFTHSLHPNKNVPFYLDTDTWMFGVILVVVTAAIWAERTIQKKSSLVLDRNEIRLKHFLSESWRIPWRAIRSIELMFESSPIHMGWRYVIKTTGGRRVYRINPLQWALEAPGGIPIMLAPKQLWDGRIETAENTWARSELHHLLGNPKIQPSLKGYWSLSLKEFLFRGRGLFVLGIVILEAIYFYLHIDDGIRYAAVNGSLSFYIWVGFMGMIVLAVLMFWSRPLIEKMFAVAILMVPTLLIAWPAALQINRVTDTNGPHVVAYHKQGIVLTPDSGQGPKIFYRKYDFEKKPLPVQHLTIYRGALGFDELDTTTMKWEK